MNHSSHYWVALTGCLVFSACQQTGGHIQLATSSNTNVKTSIVGSSDSSQWEYLAAKYDTDNDARITSAEYDRSEKTFASFDRDHNGVIEALDFDRNEHGERNDLPSVSRMRARFAPMILAKYFQSDGDEEVLVRDELQAAFAVFDEDGNKLITRFEFEQESMRRGAPASRQMDRFGMLTASVAGGNAKYFSLPELTTYFDSVAKGGSLEAPRMASAPKKEQIESVKKPIDDAPNALGKWAPDFTLPMLHSEAGDELVKLSSFRGDKPVALIFGSYT